MKKIATIDIMKGVSIILVVIGHACVPSIYSQYFDVRVLYILVTAVHMPVFFYISGYLYKSALDRRISRVIKNKVKRLLIPYIGMSTFVYVLIQACRMIPKVSGFLPMTEGTVIDYVKGIIWYGNNCDKHLWFLYVLFVIMIVYWFTNKIIVNRKIHLIFAIIMLLVGEALMPRGHELGKIFYYYFFFHLGVQQYVCLNEEHKVAVKRVVAFIVLMFLYVIAYENSKGVHSQLIWLMNPVVGYFGIVTMRDICSTISNTTLQYIGKNSMGIYLWHQPFITSGTVVVLNSLGGVNRCIAVAVGVIMGIILPLMILWCWNTLCLHRGKASSH